MKLKLFSRKLVSGLLCCAEMWRDNVADSDRMYVFHRKCLRKILRIHWSDDGGTQDTYLERITTTTKGHTHMDAEGHRLTEVGRLRKRGKNSGGSLAQARGSN